MKLTSKYSINDRVYKIYQSHIKTWQVETAPITIGEVRIYARNFKKNGMFDNIGSYCVGSDSIKVEYMCYETGIGSGTIHYEETLLPTKEAATEECERRNKKPIKGKSCSK